MVQGSNVALADATTPRRSAGAEAIVREAMRTDTDLPLFVTFGAGLTELASAYLIEPRIADRLTAVWIGGPEYPSSARTRSGRARDPGRSTTSTSTSRRRRSSSTSPTIPVWQVPRDAYRQALVSMNELAVAGPAAGRVGAHLYDAIFGCTSSRRRFGLNLGRDLRPRRQPARPADGAAVPVRGQHLVERVRAHRAPRIDDDGTYSPRSGGRRIRVYTATRPAPHVRRPLREARHPLRARATTC